MPSLVIDEPNCIGCTKCIQACPVDAIVGATRAMHTVMSGPVHRLQFVRGPLPDPVYRTRPVGHHY